MNGTHSDKGETPDLGEIKNFPEKEFLGRFYKTALRTNTLQKLPNKNDCPIKIQMDGARTHIRGTETQIERPSEIGLRDASL